MECLLFGGAPSVGKSESIYRLTKYLLAKGFSDILGLVPSKFSDFYAVLEGYNLQGTPVRIVVNTATDTPIIISNFKRFYDTNKNCDIMISSIRDDSFWPRVEFFNIMGISATTHYIIEIPLAKITRRDTNFYTALTWYEKSIDKMAQHIIGFTPFNL